MTPQLNLYYRFHWVGSPTFSPENARSIGWSAWQNGVPCYHTQAEWDNNSAWDCSRCEGECWRAVEEADFARGYSCTSSAEELFSYFASRIIPDNEDGKLVVFSGEEVGSGDDGEPLVVPDMKVVKWHLWSEVFGQAGNIILPEYEEMQA